MTEIIKGEAFLVLVDYDLFDLNIRGLKGMYLKTDEQTGKYLLRFKENGEYAEMFHSNLERVNPGYVCKEDLEFASRVKTMVCTFET